MSLVDTYDEKQASVLHKLSSVIDPDLHRDFVSLGFIQELKIEGGIVSFKVELTTPACPLKESFQTQCTQVVKELAWVTKVNVTMTARKRAVAPVDLGGHTVRPEGVLSKIGCIIAVASCKGGVGKSTVAVNLAYSIAKTNCKVGIFDADVFGPSLPTMTSPPTNTLTTLESKLIEPLEYENVKLMSFGWSAKCGAAIMRGPIVSGVINQLLTCTDWGELDYLILDLPPGTGDVPLTLLQLVPLSGAVMVTTPQHVSVVDVAKGMDMFAKLKVPTVAIVENMSYFVCDGCDKKHEIFGKGGGTMLCEDYGVKNFFTLPLVPQIGACADQGTPIVLQNEQIGALYQDIAGAVVRELSTLSFEASQKPIVRIDNESILLTTSDQKEWHLSAATARRMCRCADCVSETSGNALLDPTSISDDITVREKHVIGNYAVRLVFSDGHGTGIYNYESLLSAATAVTVKPVSDSGAAASMCGRNDLDW